MEYRKLEDLRKLENNPRKISSEDFQILVKSIKDNPDYFEARPLLLSDRTGELVIIAGNQRYDAAKYLGLKEVPTYLLKGLTEEREREIVIRDNVNNGEWDLDKLSEEWGDLNLADLGLDIELEEPEKEIQEDIAPELDEKKRANQQVWRSLQARRASLNVRRFYEARRCRDLDERQDCKFALYGSTIRREL